MDHYYSNKPTSESKEKLIRYQIKDITLKFTTDNSVFSKDKVDFGSNLIIETFLENNQDLSAKILDVGCGYGPIGITLSTFYPKSRITMVDINERAINLSLKNSLINKVESQTNIFQSNIFENISESFDYILTNPPIRAGKKVVHSIYEKAYEHMNENGYIYVVIQKKQGAPSSFDKLTELFGNCTVLNKQAGFQILVSQKKEEGKVS